MAVNQDHAHLIDEAARLAEESRLTITRDLIARYVDSAVPEYLDELAAEDLLGLVHRHCELAASRGGSPAVRVFTPSTGEDGWARSRTIVQCVAEDMPFLVDSVEGAVRLAGHRIHAVVHPIMEPGSCPGDGREGGPRESWICLETERMADEAEERAVAARIEDVIDDVARAVGDWDAMQAELKKVAEASEGETSELLSWLGEGNFTPLGALRFDIVDGEFQLVEDSRLGLLTEDHRLDAIDIPGRGVESPDVFVTKASWRSTVRRIAYCDVVAVRADEADYRFLGLFTSTAYQRSVVNIPLLRVIARDVFDILGVAPDSHTGRDLLETLETYPRDLLFQADIRQLAQTAMTLVQMRERHSTRVFITKDAFDRSVSALVVTPRDQYNTKVRVTIEKILRETFNAADVEYATRVSEATLAQLHYILRGPDLITEVDEVELQHDIQQAVRNWEEDFEAAALAEVGEAKVGELIQFGHAFPQGYKAAFTPRVAVTDALSCLGLTGVRLNLYRLPGAPGHTRRLKLYSRQRPALTDILPLFTHLGLKVIDERPYEVVGPEGIVNIVDFGLEASSAEVWESPSARERFQDGLLAALEGRVESDGYAGLILSADMTWREATILRSLGAYIRQGGANYSKTYVVTTLRDNARITRELVDLVSLKFDPQRFDDGASAGEERRASAEKAIASIEAQLAEVASLDQERILRWFLTVIRACYRTNIYAEDTVAMAYKLAPSEIPMLPEPRPMWEIWVYSPRLEGVHLRFGMVARGGLRWSDRREDFRTEVLGLVKAQMVKNAVIVPTGSKGGFFPKQLPDPAEDRDAWAAEGKGAYIDFITALLSVTDNLVEGEVVPPAGVVRHDGDDTYLVVAADKGTAKFSDDANAVAAEQGFWLDDAFASGGSAGYDHKGMGITARGAWESTKAHLREIGIDSQAEDFTACGIGDMSGDVFGNGMLLSKHIRLVGAFDHRHVFIDPNPDAASSWAERKRLFDLPRSSWADYSADLISSGGGVFPRTAKAITVTKEMAERFDLEEGAKLTPQEMIRAVLTAPVDLLFNGGVGTYIKSADETNAEVGDKANDPIRINGEDLRARVVVEGGNLGATQRGRIEVAKAGIIINTDAIDNSAGVDTSDHEVNIKIHLSELVRRGDMTLKERNELLQSMTDDVAASVLTNNYDQNLLLANAHARAVPMLGSHRRLLTWLEENAGLDRELEFLPSDAELADRSGRGEGLTTPEFAILVAYMKLALKDILAASDVPDMEWCADMLTDYFPPAMRIGKAAQGLEQHPLRREIIINRLVNHVVNAGGITFVFRAAEETAAPVADVVRAFLVAEEVFSAPQFAERLESLDGTLDLGDQSDLYLAHRQVLDRSVRWLLQSRADLSDIGAAIERFKPAVDSWAPRVGEALVGEDLRRHEEAVARLEEIGLDPDFALWAQGLLDSYSILDAVRVSEQTGCDVDEVFRVYSRLGERFRFDELLSLISELPATNFWQAMSRTAARGDAYAALSEMTKDAIETGGEDPVQAWLAANAEEIERVDSFLERLHALEETPLAPISVMLRSLRNLAQ